MKRRIALLGLPLVLAAMQNAGAVSFGAFDPRSMAMGGAGVASGTSANASFYNPALLAAARKDEDFSLELPIIAVRLADPDEFISSLDDFQKANDSDAFSNAITQWNNAASPAELLTAKNAVVATGADLVKGFGTLSNKALQADINVGMVLGIPSRRWGAALYLDARVEGGALLDITQSDLDNINAVIDGLNTNNFTGILDGSGNLIDPTASLSSSLQARGAVISDIGISLAREFTVAGYPLAFGVTPKYMEVDTFDYKVDVNTGDITIDQGKKSYKDFNLDVGAAHDYGNGWKMGLVVKNVMSKDYATALGNTIKIEPQARWGIAYAGSMATAAMDVDLTENSATGLYSASQYVALGAELSAWQLFQFRLGYRYNMSNSDASSVALGMGLSPLGIHMDLAVVGSDKEIGVGLQTGFRF